MSPARVGAIVGATGVGKSELAVAVAERLDAEIISVDSMQIYSDMDVGTAKPEPLLRRSVPHHLLDVFPPSHELTVAEYQTLGRAAIENVVARGRRPLLVGGSGLYFRAIVDEFDFPPRDDEVRAALDAEAERIGPRALHSRLRTVDAKAAANIEPTNVRRTIRALEVIELTGRPFSEGATVWYRYESRYDLRAAGISRDRAELKERISARVDKMLAAGLVDEAVALDRRGIARTARQALGYRQVLDAGPDADVATIREEIVRATVRFARRQESWFRADRRIRWFEATPADLVDAVCDYLES